MDEPKVSFHSDLLNKMQEIAFLKMVAATSTEEQMKSTKTFIRAFTKRGVPMSTIIDALIEMCTESLNGGDDQ